MNRTSIRFASVAVLLLAIIFVTLPTAEARELSGSQKVVTSSNDLWNIALAWILNLLPGGHAGRTSDLSHLSSAATAAATTVTRTVGRHPVSTGSCIDPMGGNCSN